MPTRMIRDALLNSDRFLSLPDNTARICYVACLLTADDRGNLEGGTGHLVRMWRDFGVDSTEKAVSISLFLADRDLIRLYAVSGKAYIHVPRFQQRMRSFKRACEPSPWCEKIEESTNTSSDCPHMAAIGGNPPPEVKRSEENKTFEQFWDSYPRKKSKGQAEKAWRKLSPNEPLTATILQAVLSAKKSDDWLRDSGKFIPYPATWLNAEGWKDEVQAKSNGLAL